MHFHVKSDLKIVKNDDHMHIQGPSKNFSDFTDAQKVNYNKII